MSNEYINPATVHKPIFSYSHAVKSGNTLYISMQLPLDLSGKLVGPGDPTAQAEQVYTNLKNVLEAAGGSLKDIVKLTTLLSDIKHRPAAMEVRNRFFEKYRAPSIIGAVSDLLVEGALIQVDGIAVLGEK
jgi:2-iminobutanoate/2-iminopropanoate deaminase